MKTQMMKTLLLTLLLLVSPSFGAGGAAHTEKICLPELTGTLRSEEMAMLSYLPGLTGTLKGEEATMLSTANQIAEHTATGYPPKIELTPEQEEKMEVLSMTICRLYSQSDFPNILKLLEMGAQRRLGRKFTVADIYPYVECHELLVGDMDLIRVTVENPITTELSSRDLVYHFVDEGQVGLLGKIVTCRWDFGDGCVDIFEHIEKKRKESPLYTKELRKLEGLLRKNIDPVYLKRYKVYCQEFLKEPLHCQ